VTPGHLRLHVLANIDLGRLRFLEKVSEAQPVVAHQNYMPSMADVMRLCGLLADAQVIVRHVLQAPPPGYPDPGGFACDLHGKDETNFSGPDVHIRILRDASATRAEIAPVRFEVNVSGLAASDDDREYIKKVAAAVTSAVRALCGRTELGEGVVGDSPAAEDWIEESVPRPTEHHEVPDQAERLDVLLMRFEQGLDRLTRLLGTLRSGSGA
jgi:hypothetical protein